MEIYNKVREVPKNAQKTIAAGRLKGMTDINPQWRIEKLTEIFGPCGDGWYTKEIKREFVNGANEEIMCFLDIELYVNYKKPMNLSENSWSKQIFGTGGSTFIAKESKGLYTSDEAVKMAYTDAISVACKQLGFGADIYWNKSDSKYNKGNTTQQIETKVTLQSKPEMIDEGQIKSIQILLKEINQEGLKEKMYAQIGVKSSKQMTKKQATSMINALKKIKGE